MSSQSDLWKEFGNEFARLAREEEGIARKKDQLLGALSDCKSASPFHGPLPECGLWNISGGVSENFQARFRALASRAGVALGSPKGTAPEDSWLHHLYLDLRENDSKHLIVASRDGGVISRVCKASGTFCARLERKALEANGAQQTREAFLRQILDKEGFSVNDWAARAKVDFHTANDYLKGKKKPYPSTLKKLADALGRTVAEMAE